MVIPDYSLFCNDTYNGEDDMTYDMKVFAQDERVGKSRVNDAAIEIAIDKNIRLLILCEDQNKAVKNYLDRHPDVVFELVGDYGLVPHPISRILL